MKNIKAFDLFEMSKVDYNEKLEKFYLCFNDIHDLLYKEFKKYDDDDIFTGGVYYKDRIADYLENDEMPQNGILFYQFYLPPYFKGAQLNLVINNGNLKITMWYSDQHMNTQSVWIFKSPISQIDGKEQIFLKALVESIKNKLKA